MTLLCNHCEEEIYLQSVGDESFYICYLCESKRLKMRKTYVDRKTYDSLLAASTYNQKIGDAMDAYGRIGLSDDFSYKQISGARIKMFMGHEVPNLFSECMIKYRMKKDD